MKYTIDSQLASKVLSVVDAGLCRGMGEATPGQMCVEAAVCYAMGLPHSDNPPCVNTAARSLKIPLNDSGWSSNESRAKGMRRLAIAQLGTNEWDLNTTVEFAKRVAELAAKVAAKYADESAKYAAESAKYAEYAAESAEYAKYAKYAEYAEYAAEYAAKYAAKYAEYAAKYAAKYAADKILADFAEEVVQILIQLKAPGTEFLPDLIAE